MFIKCPGPKPFTPHRKPPLKAYFRTILFGFLAFWTLISAGSVLGQDPGFRIIQVETELAPKAGNQGPDFYLNAGRGDGIKENMLLDVFRPVTVYDPVKDSEQEVKILIGQIKVIRVYEETAVSRIHFLEDTDTHPVVTYRTVMVGDIALPKNEEEDMVKISLSASVLFDFNRSQLKASARSAMEQVFETLSQYPNRHLIIEGHTCNVGQDKYNRSLSLKRAKRVADYLVSIKGVDKARIRVVGHGEKFPISSNSTEVGRRQNRRVDFRLIPAGEPIPLPTAVTAAAKTP